MCSLCYNAIETSKHLFSNCNFVVSLWSWLSSMINKPIDLCSFSSILDAVNSHWSDQTKDVVLSAIINVIHTIWFCRNQIRFNNQNVRLRSAITMISAATTFSGSISRGCMSAAIDEFSILKAFKVIIHPCKAPIIKQVDWYPSFVGWIKCNLDGESRGNPGFVSLWIHL